MCLLVCPQTSIGMFPYVDSVLPPNFPLAGEPDSLP